MDMLRSCYDLSRKEKFRGLFGGLWIVDNPTPLQSACQVLYLDCSRIGGTVDELKKTNIKVRKM